MPAPGDSSGSLRLSEHVATVDAARFIGRVDVLAAIEDRIDDTDVAAVIFVHGPGGVGKSALLRELHRRARARGTSCSYRRATDPSPVPAVRLLLIDDADDSELTREDGLGRLPASTVAVIAGRTRPPAAWFRDGWEHVVSEVALPALSDQEAEELLARHGVGGDRAIAAKDWAGGLPLALHVAATQVGDQPTVELSASVAHRLVGDDLGELDMPVLAVAAIVREATPELIRSLLPGRDVSVGLRQLRRLSTRTAFAEALAMPEILRQAVRVELRQRDVTGYRNLVVRVAEHIYRRLVRGEYWLMDELAALIEDPAVRWGYSKGSEAQFRVTPTQPQDVLEAADALHARGTIWWQGVERFLSEAPDTVTVVRDRQDALAGFSIVTTPETAPKWVGDDVVLGPSLAHARRHHPDTGVVFFRDSFDLTADAEGNPGSQVVALLNSPPQLAEELPYARRFYGVVNLDNAPARELAAAVGAVGVPELSVADGERRLGTYVLDHGPGGVAGAVRAIVRAEQAHPLVSPAIGPPADAACVRAALRSFHDPVALAASPLAIGADLASRAESVRALLRHTIGTAFGHSAAERQLRRLLEIGYLDGDAGHRRAMAVEHLSRSSYYRQLAGAVARVAAALG